MASEKLTSKMHAWFCSSDLPSDVVIQVEHVSYHLHKLPLMLKSLKLHKLIAELEEMSKVKVVKDQKRAETEGEERKEELEKEDEITLADFPGGSETFEIAAKFCYGLKIDLSPSNVVALRCAGDFLQMTEEYFEDNLISITERYLSQKVLRNMKPSIQTLHSCQSLLPLAENLGIVQRCIDSVAAKSSSVDPSQFGWPVGDGATLSRNSTPRKLKLNGTAITGPHFWFEEAAVLNLQIFKRLILAMKSKNTKPEIIESCLISYGRKHNLLNSRANRKSSSSSSSSSSENEQKELLETIVAYLPRERSPNSPISARFLCGLLRTACILNASEACRSVLEKKIGVQLEQATLDYLLIPSYSYLTDTLYDVDCVERILGYFLQGLEDRSSGENDGDVQDSSGKLAALVLVGKLVDDFLSEISSDANLKPEKFHQLAVSLPEHARLFDDGLYRAVDIFLKVHPWISEGERETICSILDCQKLTLEACTHAAQNERLPLRTLVQVLFFEQMQLRHAIAETASAAVSPARTPRVGCGEDLSVGGQSARGRDGNRSSSARRDRGWENRVLRLSMDGMRTRMRELEHECSTMKQVIQRIDTVGPSNGGGFWSSKLGCKFNTQVCDSQQPTSVVEYRKGRSHRNHHQSTL